MRFISADIRRYRSIEETMGFQVDPRVTCLVGKNESGKTAVLQALFKSNPIDTSARFVEVLDYPSRLTRERSKTTGPIEVTALTYQFSPDNISNVDALFGEGALPSKSVVITTGYRQATSTWDLSVNEAAVVAHLRKDLDLPSVAQAIVDSATTVAELTTALEALETPTPDATAVMSRVSEWRESDATLAIIDLLGSSRPKFVYFGDYDTMPGKVSIPDLIRGRDAETLSRGEEAVLSLLELAGVDPKDFLDPDSHEHLVRDMENASNSITDEVFKYWSQNTNLAVELSIMNKPEPGTPAIPSNEAPFLQIRVKNERHRVSVPFDERSRGFVWFFSFLAYFSQLEQTSMHPLILLLDEPGLNLHATAQNDLLRFIDERLAPTHQVLFSTHSPFMINAHALERVRTVMDIDSLGTVVSSDIFESDAETAFPLHAALGIELTQTLFVGPNVVLVEGPADVVYLEVLSNILKAAGREGLDDRWVLMPVTGAGKLPAFVTLLGANKLNTVVLVDSTLGDTATVHRIREAGKLGSGGIVLLGQVLGTSAADIEDLFEPPFYVELVNRAYQGLLAGNSLTVAELPTDQRLVRRVERAFEARSLTKGRINHYSPAAALLRGQADLVSQIAPATLQRAEDVIHAINVFMTA